MCLHIKSRVRDFKRRQPNFDKGIGWKIFNNKKDSSELCFNYRTYANSRIVPTNQWIKAENKSLYVDIGQNKQFMAYLSGFHIFLKKPPLPRDNIFHPKATKQVVKVKWKDALSVGYEKGLPIVVADQMFVPKKRQYSMETYKKTPTELGLEAALNLERLFHAETKLELWRVNFDIASSKIMAWDQESDRLKAKSQGTLFEVKPYASY